ncbi:MAG: biopolymer transporter ExbD [Gemmatimonadetes bacterium]|nr:MAG: biopolymer transporter ExbD [Gemmatimonadota bacterium]
MPRRRDRAGGFGGGDLSIRADINVTSLVDIAFTLLIIFIITAPILQGGIEVAVPEAQVDPLRVMENSLIVTIDREDQVYLAETQVPREDLAAVFGQLVGATSPERVLIQADSAASWAPVLEVMGLAKEAGLPFAAIGNRPPRR